MSETPASGTSRQREVIAEHLPPGYGLGFNGPGEPSRGGTPASQPATTLPGSEESSLKLQGGDIHRDLFKLSAGPTGLQRSKTFSHPASRENDDHGEVPPIDVLQQPQGFRRQYIRQRYRRLSSADIPITRDFVEFLDLYGSFAGEDLADSDEEAVEEEEGEEEAEAAVLPAERRPLLGRRKTSRAARKGDAGTARTFFTTLKAFVGTGIMFLPKAFKNGGILFSSATMLFVAIVSMIAFHLLLQCRARYGGSYGDLGREIVGPKMRAIILGSIALSQLGFVCAGLVFVADNWYSFFQAVSSEGSIPGIKVLIAIQAAIIVPLSFIRNISKLGPAALLADVFILIGLVYIYQYDISALFSNGIHKSVVLFNPKGYTLTLGASIFTFEGIGLILPIQSSMKKPHQFEPLLAVVMVIITVVFTSVGALCYATFGTETQIEVINNFPQDSKLVNAVQFMYALAVLIGNPVQLFPALRIVEAKIFGHHSGKKDLLTKWKKNAFRTSLVALCVGISIAGSENLDRFVALIGSVACIPLVYLYPAYLHYKGCAESRAAKIGDVTMMVVGTVCMIYSTTITILNSFV
ncbi:vacuolar amino acid transporter 3 [Coniochaeta ligniaria NRRL 30616]|uniref:Vacuolar amino acid transporter 3 n=1 Tax=Coniochaeta ligniaria NRRL 30616 TaxID=1408157 RepID=A0A1J7J3U2_9PEZI|nr:vacuolar amino acid transporter 3 [Coniochaeta ligniaria NRRL 30616]